MLRRRTVFGVTGVTGKMADSRQDATASGGISRSPLGYESRRTTVLFPSCRVEDLIRVPRARGKRN